MTWQCNYLYLQEQQRQELGEQVYPLVEKLAGPGAGLVTGMILTLDIDVVEQAVQEPEVRHHVAFCAEFSIINIF